MFDYEAWVASLVIVGEEAYLPDELPERRRQWLRNYGKRPEVRDRKYAYLKEWRERNREKYLAAKREQMRRYRAQRKAA